MVLQHKSKLRVYRELKQEIGFEEYLEYIKGARSKLFSKFRLGIPMGCLSNWVGMIRGGGSQECPNCGAYKE